MQELHFTWEWLIRFVSAERTLQRTPYCSVIMKRNVKIDEKTLNPTLTTIGDADPIGICGSGIIDLICQMILTGIIDRRGKIHRDIDNRRIRFNEYEMGEYVLAFENEVHS